MQQQGVGVGKWIKNKDASHTIEGMIQYDPKLRMTIQDVLASEWFADMGQILEVLRGTFLRSTMSFCEGLYQKRADLPGVQSQKDQLQGEKRADKRARCTRQWDQAANNSSKRLESQIVKDFGLSFGWLIIFCIVILYSVRKMGAIASILRSGKPPPSNRHKVPNERMIKEVVSVQSPAPAIQPMEVSQDSASQFLVLPSTILMAGGPKGQIADNRCVASTDEKFI
uniref:Uncharacterized protein n=2 Tax=Spironucleus salmonicida TaxID=348837 RepID=V6LVX0_9EUKA|eukprot:EST48777.1 Hypothetical protein SS50377_11013 [Spironucleus salmonicida]